MWANRNFHTLKDQGLANAHEQGSQAWLDGRKGRITGSKPSTLFFNFKEEKDWDTILEQWFGDKKEDFDEIALARMAHGTHFEDISVKVILDSIPGSEFFESGGGGNWKPEWNTPGPVSGPVKHPFIKRI